MTESISFDRAAGIYDATRALPGDVGPAITRVLLEKIAEAGADRVLEVGIGTGRIARPLMAGGVHMVGVDISSEMIGRLRAQLTPEHTQPDLLFGDATKLPLRDGAFQVVLIVHVLHLVASVEDALAEIRRVMAAGGVLLQQTRRSSPETQRIWDDSAETWDRLLTRRDPAASAHLALRRARSEVSNIRRVIGETGAELRVVEVINWPETQQVDEEMRLLRERSSSWTWGVPEAIFDDALSEYESWLRGAVGPAGTWVDDVTYQIEVWRWD